MTQFEVTAHEFPEDRDKVMSGRAQIAVIGIDTDDAGLTELMRLDVEGAGAVDAACAAARSAAEQLNAPAAGSLSMRQNHLTPPAEEVAKIVARFHDLYDVTLAGLELAQISVAVPSDEELGTGSREIVYSANLFGAAAISAAIRGVKRIGETGAGVPPIDCLPTRPNAFTKRPEAIEAAAARVRREHASVLGGSEAALITVQLPAAGDGLDVSLADVETVFSVTVLGADVIAQTIEAVKRIANCRPDAETADDVEAATSGNGESTSRSAAPGAADQDDDDTPLASNGAATPARDADPKAREIARVAQMLERFDVGEISAYADRIAKMTRTRTAAPVAAGA